MMRLKILGEESFEINDVLDWDLYDGSLRTALVDEAARQTNIPPKYQHWWTGEVDLDPVDGTKFFVTISVDDDLVE